MSCKNNGLRKAAEKAPKRPVIFLDVDGVLITRRSLNMRTPTPRCVQRLNELCRASGAALVVSSVWRLGQSLKALRSLLRGWGVEGRVIGSTPDINGEERGREIAAWLLAHPETERYVILDDDADMAHLKPQLVQTGFTYGLTHHERRRAAAVLTREPIALNAE